MSSLDPEHDSDEALAKTWRERGVGSRAAASLASQPAPGRRNNPHSSRGRTLQVRGELHVGMPDVPYICIGSYGE